ncbi:response regulator [Sporosarcina ureilytica]|uniref:DNA-binding response regulator n=1 Tax=Sporosarcina ureilytica TaxID=298596 RepID=A0A1D8JIS9_9BACL|nr:response regulator [Sporosarcina ureilytica]AOV08619.1 hypothetical protein BI350_14470 [Sporosarcina ureilytica]
MNKVIIVEDDRIIRRSICNAPWEENGFILAGEASDGESALELIEKEQPQVVISDITMPFMNGLEMARIIKVTSPHTKVIFLTGYEDFKYAQEAIKLQAFDYLLKPIKIEKLIRKAQSAAIEYEKEIKKERRFHDTLPLLQQSFLQKLTNNENENTDLDIEKELLELGVELDGPFFTSMFINFTSVNEEEAVIKKQITEIMRNLFSESINGHVINGAKNEMAVFLSTVYDGCLGNITFARQAIDKIYNQFDETVTITIGRTYCNVFDIHTSYLEARFAMDMKHIMGTGCVYSIDDTVPCEFQHEKTLLDLEKAFKDQLKLGLPGKAKETIEQLRNVIKGNKNIQLEETKILALKYSTLLLYQVKKWEKDESESSSMTELFNLILQMNSIQEMLEILHQLVDEWAESMNEEKKQNHNSLVDKAMAFMNEHYHDEELTQQKVAQNVFVSAPYLSNLFKVEKGLNFGDYLLELRMKKAMELLRLHDAKIYKVAESVGYRNPQYFSISFKKYTGQTPGEYRRGIINTA